MWNNYIARLNKFYVANDIDSEEKKKAIISFMYGSQNVQINM